MSYTPPGVETQVKISDTVISLPGGTRILSLIGNADRTKTTQAEGQTQPSNRTVTLNASGVNTILDIYDYSGPGSSQLFYGPSTSGTYGDGYFVSGDTVQWTVASNPFPVSTTPAVSTAFYVSYNYSGTANDELDTVAQTSGVRFTSVNYSNVTSVIAVSGASVIYSGATVDPSGAGWSGASTELVWLYGTYGSYSAAEAHNKIPVIGSGIKVSYNYSGTKYAETHTMSSNRQNTLNIPTVLNIVAVSGSAIAYPLSGTVTGIDSYGYGIDGSGYWLSGTTVAWSPVNPSAYSYPYATVPRVGNVFYVDYTSNKTSDDYQPKNFVDYRSVINQYGPEAYWTLLTTGANAGSYTIDKITPLTIGAKMAFSNNASLVMLVQNSGVGNTSGDYLSSVAKLEPKTVDVIVPLTIGSGISRSEMPVSERVGALNYVKLHCQTMANQVNKKERVSLGSLGAAEVGDSSTPNTYIYTAGALASKRATLVAPGTTTIQLQDPAGVYQSIDIDGCFLASAVGALSCSPLSDVATPLTNQQLTGFSAISAKTAGHIDPEYYNVEKNNLAAAGVMVIDTDGVNIFVRHQLTTDQSNVVNGEFSVVTLIDYVAQAVRYSCNQYIGKKLKPASTIPAVKGTILSTLQALVQNDIISTIGSVVVSINPSNPTELLVESNYVPIFPLNRIRVTFTISTLG